MSSPSLPPLPPGWTEHKAPTGHSYFYHAATKTSTYNRPAPATAVPPPPPPPPPPTLLLEPPAPVNLPPRPPAQTFPPPFQTGPFPYPQHLQQPQALPFNPSQGLGITHSFPKTTYEKPREKPDRPKRKRPIPGAEPWVQVTTRAGRTFVHNPVTKISLWSPPAEIRDAVERMKPETEEERKERRTARKVEKARALLARMQEEDQERRMGGGKRDVEPVQRSVREEQAARRAVIGAGGSAAGGGISAVVPVKKVEEQVEEEEEEEYEEEEEDEIDEHEMKRLKLEAAAKPVEFTEDDIAWQLQAMQEDADMDLEGYDLGGPEEQLDKEEAKEIFKEMLLEYEVNPYGTWDSEMPKIVNDERYTVLNTTKARKEVFTIWCKERIAVLKAEKEKERKLDPKVPFFMFLAEHCTGKQYWVEFKRKFRKEKEMKDVRLSDKERERLYREFVSHFKLSPALRENDLIKLLKSLPLSQLNGRTSLSYLPDALLTDVRYHVFSPPPSTAPPTTSLRDSIILDHISTLPSDADDSLEAQAKAREEERRRGEALREREAKIEREKRRIKAEIGRERDVLRGEEMMVERAKMVKGREGLKGYLKEGGKE